MENLDMNAVIDTYERHNLNQYPIDRSVAAVIVGLEKQIAALVEDNAGLLTILRELDYSDPARATGILSAIRDQEHPGRTLMGTLTGRLAALQDLRVAVVRYYINLSRRIPAGELDPLDVCYVNTEHQRAKIEEALQQVYLAYHPRDRTESEQP